MPPIRAVRSSAPDRPPTAAPRGGLLSSAILYVAIVVIWAAVLIPRWLRRDSAAPASGSVPAVEAEGRATVDLADEEQPAPVRPPSRRFGCPGGARSRREEPPR